MVSHDLAAIRQTTHRMIYLEESIRFDGPTEDFPDLKTLADLRGIQPVHGNGDESHPPKAIPKTDAMITIPTLSPAS